MTDAASIEHAPPSERGRLIGLQWGRALAALSVVLTHSVSYPLPETPSLFHLLGRYGVTLFFVISGVVMIWTTGRAQFSPLEFMRRRIVRIVPLYALVTLASAALAFAVPNLFKHTQFELQHVIASLLFIPVYEPGGSGLIEPFMKLGWTLNFEMFFYVIVALTFAFALRARIALLFIVLVGLSIIGQWHDFSSAPLKFYTRIDGVAFLMGALIGWGMLEGRWRMPALMHWALWLVSLAILAGVRVYYDVYRLHPLLQLSVDVAAAMQVACLVQIGAGKESILGRAGSALGDASYALYLSHLFVVGLVVALFRRLAPDTPLALEAVVAFTMSVIGGLAVYRLIERPITRLLSRAGRPSRAPQTA